MTRYRNQTLTPSAWQPAKTMTRPSNSASWTTVSTWDVHTRYHVKEMWDEVTPNFQTRKNSGDIVINPMTSIVYDVTAIPFLLHVGLGSSGRERYDSGAGVLSGKWPITDAVPTVLIDEAVTEAVTKARADFAAPTFAGLTAIAELGETLDLLKSPLAFLAAKTRQYARKVSRARERHRRRQEFVASFMEKEAKRLARYEKRHGSSVGFVPRKPPEWVRRHNADPSRDPQLLRTLSSLWLTYRYGIMPLVYSVQDALKAIAQAHEVVRHTGRGQVERSHSLTESPRYAVDNYNGYQYGSDNTYTSTVKVRAFVVGDLEVDFLSKMGLTLADVPSALWEGATLSFVADWFLNVGEFLGALTADARGNIRGSGVTIEVSTKISCAAYLAVQPGFTNYGGATGAIIYTGSTTKKTRKTTGLLDIGLVSRIDMNAHRYADAVALIHQLLVSKR